MLVCMTFEKDIEMSQSPSEDQLCLLPYVRSPQCQCKPTVKPLPVFQILVLEVHKTTGFACTLCTIASVMHILECRNTSSSEDAIVKGDNESKTTTMPNQDVDPFPTACFLTLCITSCHVKYRAEAV